MKLERSRMTLDDIQQIAVIGAGLMGHGIAQEFAFAGYQVHLHDVSQAQVDAGMERIRGNLQVFVENDLARPNQIDETLNRIQGSDQLEVVAGEADFVIEAVIENLPLKQEVFRQLDQICPPRTILASNTTAQMPSQIGRFTQRQDKILNTHYFNPPYLIPLVELIRSPQTSDETLQVAYDLMVKIGKTPAVIQKEVPGFVGPRLQAAVIREAFSIVERGIATAEDVDLVVRNSFGRRLSVAGPFQVFELAGWDLVLAAFEELYKDLNSSSEINPLLREMVEGDKLGVKSGEGFYEWTPEKIEEIRDRMNRTLIGRMKDDAKSQ
ncbi:3-hydroxybutyryl-CoA dehydrogenase [Candidatus Poribacteria bacterium]|nr:MAG: 3-hydroxybutyryl-CoA dehydrogenase [Candidatus Poribacteria bacterium]